MKAPKRIGKHLLQREPSEIAANVDDDLRAVAFHLSNLVDLLRLKHTNKLGTSRVAQAIADFVDGRVPAIHILDLVDQEDACREVERLPARARSALTH